MTEVVDTGIDNLGIRRKHFEMLCRILDATLPAEGCRVYVFGSRARSTARRSSDIDLAVEARCGDMTRHITSARTALEESTLPYTVDLLDLDHVGAGLEKIIREEGKIIWSRHASG